MIDKVLLHFQQIDVMIVVLEATWHPCEHLALHLSEAFDKIRMVSVSEIGDTLFCKVLSEVAELNT